MLKTFASFSFGCRVNEAEKLSFDNKLLNFGFSYNYINPDYYIINSCAVTNKAEREVRQFIYQVRKKYPKTKIVLTGCAATQWLSYNLYHNIADIVLSNKNKYLIPEIIGGNISISSSSNTLDYKDKFINSGRIIIKIQDGCARFCTYCIVPYLRGKPISKTIEEIVDEIKSYRKDIFEIILAGINTEYFGKENQQTIPQLLDTLLQNTTIPRFSFGSIHPLSIDNNFLKWYKKNRNNPRFVHYLHIPIQSGSDKILKIMNRGYETHEISAKLNAINKISPTTLIGTDIITGFPAETDDDFIKTYEFLLNNPISKIHVFRYSPKKGTPSAKNYKLQSISSNVIYLRSQKLQNLSRQKNAQFSQFLTGYKSRALVLPQKIKNFYQVILDNGLVGYIPDKGQNIIPGIIDLVKVNKYEHNKITVSRV